MSSACPDKATEAMHARGVILLPIAREPTQPDQQPECRFPEDPIHLIEQPAEIVGEAILLLCRHPGAAGARWGLQEACTLWDRRF